MIAMPKEQYKHKYIDRKIMPWIDLHFPADSSFDGRIVLCYRRKDNQGIYNVTRSDISKLADFVSEMHISPDFPIRKTREYIALKLLV